MAYSLNGIVNDSIVSNGTLRIGHFGSANDTVGAGSFTVDSGTALVLKDPEPEAQDNPIGPILSIGRYSGSVGYGLITGAGSTVSLLIDTATTSLDSGAGVNVGRDGGQGTLIVDNGGRLELISTDTLSLNAINVGRGTSASAYDKPADGFLMVSGGSVAVEGLGALLRAGRDGGQGFVVIEQNSAVDLTGQGDDANARLQVAFQNTATNGETRGTMIVSESVINIKALGDGGRAAVSVAADGDLSLPSKLVGTLLLTDNALINVTGERASANFGAVANASAEVTIQDSSQLIVTDTDSLDQGGAFIGIGNANGVLKANVTVTGAGSRLEAVDGYVLVGGEPSFGVVGNGLLTLKDGGTLAADFVTMGRGGTVVGSDASIIANVGLDSGTLRLATGGPLTLTGGLFASIGGTLRFDVADDGAGGLVNGRLDHISADNLGVAFADAKIVIDSIDGTKFLGGDTLLLGTSDSGFFFLNEMNPADVSVTEQGAGFGFMLSNANLNLTFKALNDGAVPGVAVLDFGTGNLFGATFTYDTASQAGRGSGGQLWDVIARGVDEVNGTAGDDAFTVVGSGGLVLRGFGGNDVLNGGAGSDILDGGTENDTLNGGAGADNLDGGADGDTLLGGAGADKLTGGAGADSLDGGTEADTLEGGAGADTLNGGTEADTMDGGADADGLLGGAGADTLIGGAGGDTLDGGTEADVLIGGTEADTLTGGTGADVLIGGLGLDKLTGGADKDRFIYTARTDSNPGSTADRILDFDDAGDDRIDLAAVYAKTLTYVGSAAFTKIGQVRINDIKGADVVVEVNLDTDSAAEMQIRLVGTTLASMSKGDFIL